MAITTDNNVYHDDFVTSNVEAKNYLRILFKAGYSVQVRELNQMQSILQSQIDKFGQSVWKDGAAAIGGSCTYDQTIQYIDANVTGTAVATAILTAATVTNSAGLSASILGVKSLGGSAYRLFLRYSNSATGGVVAAYIIGNNFNTNNSLGVTVTATGYAAGLFLSKGVFFTKGSFVATNAQSIFFTLDTKDASVNGKAYLYVAETYVNYTTDSSLTDNANGTPNYNAPGADRYAVNLTLTFEAQGSALNTSDKISLLTVVNSVPTVALRDRYSDLDRQLAQRTYEESGNYTLNPFKTHIRELYDTGSNYGRYSSSELDKAGYSISAGDLPASIADAQARYSLGVDPSVAYVYGYRVAPLDKTELNAPKARTVSALTPANTYANIGNYVIGSFETGSYLPIITEISSTYRVGLTKTYAASAITTGNSTTITLPNTTGITVGMTMFGASTNANAAMIAGVVITSVGADTIGFTSTAIAIAANEVLNFVAGTTKIKGVEVEGASTYRLYLYDITITASGGFNLADITRVWNIAGTPVRFTVAAGGALAFAGNDTALFKLPFDAVNSLTNIRYNILHTASGVVTTTTTIALTVTSPERAFSDLTPGNIILFVAGAKKTVTSVSGSGSSITLNFSAATAGDAFTVIIPVDVGLNTGGAGVMTKTLTSQTDTITATAAQKIFTLTKAELFAITSVTIGGVITTSDWIIRDDGQRDNYFTNVKLKYVGKKSFTNENIVFVYRHFVRSGGSACASVNSYLPSATNTALGLTYSGIPLYKSVRLADCIDFRPVILSGGSGVVDVLNPYSIISAAANYYLPRIDKVCVDSNGNFEVTQGNAELNPRAPETPPKSMALYTLGIAAYTHSTSDIISTYIDNRRYTMRDIGGLESRIKNIEYYTTLSLLEKSANDKPIFDSAGSRFKNGILVDAFFNTDTANIASEAYAASIDITKGILYPQYSTRRFDFKKVGNSLASIKINSNTATLSYVETPLISQPYASEFESVNPYDLASFVGTVTLTPGSDEWKEVTNTTVYAALNKENFNAVKDTALLGTVWNEWTTNWIGSTVTKSAPHSVINPANGLLRQAITTTATGSESRVGLQTKLSFTDITQNTGERIVDVTFIPFIRSRKVYFSATGLKPNTKVYPFFDGIDISAYTMSVSTIVKYKDSAEVKTYNGISPANTALSTIGITTSTLTTNVAGEIMGVFLIPNNEVYKFRTGTRTFRLADSARNLPSETTTYADFNYVATGLTQTNETLITSTRIPQLSTTRVSQSQAVSKVSVKYVDPLAQSFMIGDIETGAFVTSVDLYFQSKSNTLPVTVEIVTVENGTPTQNVVPFSTVSLNPYTITNGAYNTGTAVVQTSSTASTPTRFNFSDPVYLKAGAEYAIVVKSNDPAYKLFVARVGGTNLVASGIAEKITKNVYAGVMFMSQNGSTWTPDQTRDFKFVLNRAAFLGSGSLQFKPAFSTGVESVTISAGGSGFTQAGVSVTFDPPAAGGSNITATGVATVDILTGSIVNVTVINPGTGYAFNESVTLTFANTTGSPSAPTATVNLLNVPVTTFNLAQENITVEGTAITNTLTLGNLTPIITVPNENYDLKTTFALNLSTAPNTSMTTVLSTSSDYVSPVIDLDRVSLLTVKNEINALADNDTTETTADKGVAASRYLTKTVALNNPADQLNIYISANRPTAGSKITLYAKLAYDGADAEAANYVKISPVNIIPVSSNADEYIETEYTLSSPANDFISFAIKIVFSSDTLYDVPSIRDFRVIATTGV